MKTFSDVLLELYRLAQDAPAENFQTQVLNAVREKLAFDSAVWATGVIEPEGATPHSIFAYRQPPDMLDNWGRIKPRDTLIFEAFRNLGQTINGALTSDPYWQALFSAGMKAHIGRYGMAHTLMTMIATPRLQLYTAVSFYRADPGRPFSEAERLFKQNLMPHFAEAWNISRFGFLNSARASGTPPTHGRAICDPQGVLYNADRNFPEFMFAEWPDWIGPRLPPALLAALSRDNPRRYAGRHTVVAIETVNDMKLISARKIAAIDMLSAREYDVAALCARGADYRAIAEALCIAPTTVRKHLQNIYAKLGVANKMEMAQLMQGD